MRAALVFLKEYPAVILLVFVYFIILPRSISYDQSWQQTENPVIIGGIFQASGTKISFSDIKQSFNWPVLEEGAPRPTRPLSSYFTVLDAKFRFWLWHYFPPHPSLSLVWIFTLFLAPIFLFKLLRNLEVGVNTALAAVSFYLATPGVLACTAMYFRPGKPMTNFAIIFCLYLASFFCKKKG